MRGSVGADHDPRDHQRQEDHLAGDRAGRRAELLVQPQGGEGDGDEGIAHGDDRQDRRYQRSLLEGVLVEQEAQRADHGEGVDGPVGEQSDQAAADVGDHQLDQEGGDAVVDAARQRQGQRPQVLVARGDGQAACDRGGESDPQRQHDTETYGRLPVGGPGNDKEAGHADRGGDNSAEEYGIPAFAQVGVDQDGEDQVAHQKRLDQRQRPVPEREDLQREADDGPADRRQPQRLPGQVDEYPRRQRSPALDALGTALIGYGSDPEHHRSRDGCHDSDCRRQLPVPRLLKISPGACLAEPTQGAFRSPAGPGPPRVPGAAPPPASPTWLAPSPTQLGELVQALSRAESADEVAQVIAEKGAVAAGAGFANIAVVDRAADTPARFYHAPGVRKDITERYPNLPADESTPLGAVLLSGGEIWLPSLSETAVRYPALLGDTIAAGGAATASLRLTDRHPRVIGAVGMAWGQPQAFGDAQKAEIRVVARLAADALGRAQQLEAERAG